MNKVLIRIYSVVGLLACLLYVVYMTRLIIISESIEWELSNSDYSRYLGSSIENVDWTVVIVVAFLSISFAFPWVKYYKDLWVSCKYRFCIFETKKLLAKVLCLFYMLLNLFLVFLFMKLFQLPQLDTSEGSYRDYTIEIFSLTLLVPVYLILTLAIYIKLKNKINRDNYDKNEI